MAVAVKQSSWRGNASIRALRQDFDILFVGFCPERYRRSAQEGLDRLTSDERITKLLDDDELAECFDLDRQLRNVGRIFERVLGERGEA